MECNLSLWDTAHWRNIKENIFLLFWTLMSQNFYATTWLPICSLLCLVYFLQNNLISSLSVACSFRHWIWKFKLLFCIPIWNILWLSQLLHDSEKKPLKILLNLTSIKSSFYQIQSWPHSSSCHTSTYIYFFHYTGKCLSYLIWIILQVACPAWEEEKKKKEESRKQLNNIISQVRTKTL